jgi:hypothetical protein
MAPSDGPAVADLFPSGLIESVAKAILESSGSNLSEVIGVPGGGTDVPIRCELPLHFVEGPSESCNGAVFVGCGGMAESLAELAEIWGS